MERIVCSKHVHTYIFILVQVNLFEFVVDEEKNLDRSGFRPLPSCVTSWGKTLSLGFGFCAVGRDFPYSVLSVEGSDPSSAVWCPLSREPWLADVREQVSVLPDLVLWSLNPRLSPALCFILENEVLFFLFLMTALLRYNDTQ